MRSPVILTSVVFALCLTSCDPGSTIRYEVVNKTTKPLKVEYRYGLPSSADSTVKETVIEASTSKVIYEHQPIGNVNHIDERMDSLSFDPFILEQEGQTARLNFREKKYWTLNKQNEQEATYQLFVDSTLFQK